MDRPPLSPLDERRARLALQAVLPADLAAACGIDLTDARRIVSLAHRLGELPARAPATLRRTALEAARSAGEIRTLALVERRASAEDPFVKYAFRLDDGAIVESVRIPLERPGRYSACVSSQVGCALACAFCATGRMGLTRNLEAWEIVEQVRLIRRDLAASPGGAGGAARVHGVLFQGMGEPLANADRVIQAIRVLSEPSAQAIDMRNITVCTAGLPSGIRRLAAEVPAVRLGLSLGSVRPGRRRQLMPIDGAHPLEEVLAAVGEHARATGHAPMWAYTLLAGQNDTDEDAACLAALARRFAEQHGISPRLSLIPYNAIGAAGPPVPPAAGPPVPPAAGAPVPPADSAPLAPADSAPLAPAAGVEGGIAALDPFARSARLEAFRAVLSAAGVGSIVRYSGGGDVGAACGQLARAQDQAQRPGGRRASPRPEPAPEAASSPPGAPPRPASRQREA
ncbi:RNA methyltransferase [Sorangium cellulosum]|uniref:RNA methyltransferase n=1 Tax=Sorangium cellulosum TaxID=56 RepID=A0A4P2Q1J0_SORCE|nr:radical SAM protein [Sorangium cellulosum]AUX23125.1 RNA methyltransferase [Sorangium cellulosum]